VSKPEGGWPACRDVLIRGAVLHEQLDFVAAALMERARKHEHVPPLAAQAAKFAEEHYNSTQLVRVGLFRVVDTPCNARLQCRSTMPGQVVVATRATL